MKPKAYIETTMVSYLTAWPSRDIVIAGHQQVTRQWWDSATDRFDLVASQLVIDEASAGDEDAARYRLAALAHVILLDATDEALFLAQQLAVRDRHASKFGYNLSRIFRDIKARQEASGRKFVKYPSRSAAQWHNKSVTRATTPSVTLQG